MKLKNKLFHSVHSYLYYSYRDTYRLEQLRDILDKYEMIFKSGYILPYKNIKELYGNTVNRNLLYRLNKDDMVSVSLHEDNPQEIDIKYKKENAGKVEDAYGSWVYQEPSIILNEDIMKDLSHYKYTGIYLERLFFEPISLKYMEGISIVPYNVVLDKEQYISNDLTIEFIKELKELLLNYNYNVPIIDLLTGEEYTLKKALFNKSMNNYRL